MQWIVAGDLIIVTVGLCGLIFVHLTNLWAFKFCLYHISVSSLVLLRTLLIHHWLYYTCVYHVSWDLCTKIL